MQARPLTITEAEYFRLDEESEERLEYWYGQVVAMSGERRNHAVLAHDVVAAVEGQRSDCLALTASLRVRAPHYGRANYAYPDGMMVCGEEQYDETTRPPTLLNPTLLIEVLSESTAQQDLGPKLEAYFQLDSLVEYWVLDPEQPHVRRCRRAEGGILITFVKGLQATLHSAPLGLTLPLADLYRRIQFAPDAEPDT